MRLIFERFAGMNVFRGRSVGTLAAFSLSIDRQALRRDRANGHSLTEIAKLHNVSRATVCRVLKEEVPYVQSA